MTQKKYATLRHPKMYPHTKFGIPTSKNIGDMDRTRKRDGRTDGRTDGLTDGRTVRLLYASQSSFGGIKKIVQTSYEISRQIHLLSEQPTVKNKSNDNFKEILKCHLTFLNDECHGKVIFNTI